MNFIGYVDDQFAKEQKIPDWESGWAVRIAARAVLFDENKSVALMYIGSKNFYKLPGGGVDDEEHLEAALEREMLEETGCTIKQIGEIGVFIEKRDQWKMFQVSFSYLARVVKKGELSLTDEEKAEGFELVWADSIEKAIEMVAGSPAVDSEYDGQHMKLRDLNILKKAKEMVDVRSELAG